MSKKLYRFTASWCQPCKMLSKTMEGISLDYPIEVVDIDENQELAIQYGIRGVPTLVLTENDAEVKRISGVQTEGFLKEWHLQVKKN